MNKLKFLVVVVFVVVAVGFHFLNLYQVESPQPLTQSEEGNFVEYVDLYYNLDNPDIIFERDSEGNFIEVGLNG